MFINLYLFHYFIMGKKIIDENIKMLAPTLRQKKRYLLVEIKCEKKLRFDEISKLLNKEVIYFFGAIDYTNSNFWILKDKFDFNKGTIVIRVSTKLLKKTITSLSLISKSSNLDIELNILKIGSTLKKLRV